jgi:hypothetical protein
MVQVIYQPGRGSNLQRIHDKLKPSSPEQGKRMSDYITGEQTTTQPARTVTTIYHSGSNCKHGGDRG